MIGSGRHPRAAVWTTYPRRASASLPAIISWFSLDKVRCRIGKTDMQEWPFKVLIDGECPLCRREGRILAWLDRGRNRLVIEDITVAGFEPTGIGVSMQELMGQIHGILPDGTLVKGMEVFRRAYDAVGLGCLLAPTRWPILRSVSDAGYAWFARNRLRLTGRSGACDSGRCQVP